MGALRVGRAHTPVGLRNATKASGNVLSVAEIDRLSLRSEEAADAPDSVRSWLRSAAASAAQTSVIGQSTRQRDIARVSSTSLTGALESK
jgi:hypothetical protein